MGFGNNKKAWEMAKEIASMKERAEKAKAARQERQGSVPAQPKKLKQGWFQKKGNVQPKKKNAAAPAKVSPSQARLKEPTTPTVLPAKTTAAKTAAAPNEKRGPFGLRRSSKKSAVPATTGESTQEHIFAPAAQKAEDAKKSLEILNATIEEQEKNESRKLEESKNLVVQARQKMAEGNQSAALRYMRKSKRCVLEKDKISAAVEKLDNQVMLIEAAINNLKVVEALQEGNSAMSDLQCEDTVERVDAIMEEVRDTNEVAMEVKDILSQDVSVVNFDEDDLLRELQTLEGLVAVESLSSLPVAPSGPLPVQGTTVPTKHIAADEEY